MSFRELAEDMDAQILESLGDIATVDGRDIAGFLSIPWLQPKLGRINTGIREPHFAIHVHDATAVAIGQIVSIDLPEQDGGGRYDLVGLEPDGTGWVSLILRLKR
ncbi:Uncharacterized protein ALO80_03021 [Pseudomonas caricapapayae]|uniref:Uncharacterized protein n=1 Tax=Pseudomonas caricapapayae TaxID=46678 RepID=A0A0P9K535_9PSED|nr:hypothetical protein [Pseudomonas caricapapayae]KAA8693652.1 hypothetical protein F4W67_20285 [Pseudomonas caricapapayae]KPW59170.1 Uncharacterized protein ALO80_03021 [Pseudomonas caricapapayae]RMM06031.1 hypothetical protein ALQ84_01471 [Pseudomonas caricapapayae]